MEEIYSYSVLTWKEYASLYIEDNWKSNTVSTILDDSNKSLPHLDMFDLIISDFENIKNIKFETHHGIIFEQDVKENEIIKIPYWTEKTPLFQCLAVYTSKFFTFDKIDKSKKSSMKLTFTIVFFKKNHYFPVILELGNDRFLLAKDGMFTILNLENFKNYFENRKQLVKRKEITRSYHTIDSDYWSYSVRTMQDNQIENDDFLNSFVNFEGTLFSIPAIMKIEGLIDTEEKFVNYMKTTYPNAVLKKEQKIKTHYYTELEPEENYKKRLLFWKKFEENKHNDIVYHKIIDFDFNDKYQKEK